MRGTSKALEQGRGRVLPIQPKRWQVQFSGLRAALAGAVLLLGGCQSVTGTKPLTLVRVIDASSNAPAVDVSIGGTVIAGNVGANSVTNYAYLTPQQGTVNVNASGTSKLLDQTSGSFLDNQQHSVFLTDTGSGFSTTVLTDQSSGPPAGYVSVRFLDQASIEASLDVYFVPDKASFKKYKPVLTGLTPATISAYLNIPLGAYDLVLVPTGGTKAAYVGLPNTYTGGQVRTMLIVDSPLSASATPVTVVTANDVN